MTYGEISPSYHFGKKHYPAVWGHYVEDDGIRHEWPLADCPQCGLSDWQFALDWYGGICGWCDSLMFVGMEDIPF